MSTQLTMATVNARRYPLVTLAVCQYRLRLSAEGVWDLIDEGRLPWAFDIRVGQLRELRVWMQSLDDWATGQARTAGLDLEAVLAEIVPGREWCRSPELEDWLMCSQMHVRRLAEAGELGEVEQRDAQSVRRIKTAGVKNFLRRRVIDPPTGQPNSNQ